MLARDVDPETREGVMQEMTADPADAFVAIGRSWGWVLAFGIITLLAGILTVAWPGPTLRLRDLPAGDGVHR
jgi:hypothetical protein